MDVQVNYLAVVLAAASSYVVGMAFYSKPLFGPAWQKMVGLDDKKIKEGMGSAMAMSAIPALLTAFVLAHITYLSSYFYSGGGTSWMSTALQTAFWVWLGFVASVIARQNAFEQRRKKLTAINALNGLVSLVVMGLIIGLLKPAGV